MSSDHSAKEQGTTSIGKVLLIIAITLALALLLTLGTWQVKRLFWKQDLIARIETRINKPPVLLNRHADWQALLDSDFEYLPVKVEGSFDHGRERLVYTVSELGPGYWVMTPLELVDGSTLLINRGFVPMAFKTEDHIQIPAREDNVVLTGLLRKSQTGGLLFRPNKPDQNKWFSRDIQLLAQDMNVTSVPAFFIDARRDEAANQALANKKLVYPVAGLTRISFPNNHLAYALTWYGLAAFLVGMLIYVRYRPQDTEQ